MKLFQIIKFWIAKKRHSDLYAQSAPKVCDHCQRGSLISYTLTAAKTRDNPQTAKAATSLKHYRKLRFGAIYRCRHCRAAWHYNPDSDRMSFIQDQSLKLIRQWNRRPITLTPEQHLLLSKITPTQSLSFADRRYAKEVPCRVVTTDGSVFDCAIVSIQNYAPHENASYRLGSEIAEISASPHLLPLNVRTATANARERRNSFAPTIIDVNGEIFTLNWEHTFFKKDNLSAKDVTLSNLEFDDINDMPSLAGGGYDIVFFVVDALA